MICCQRLITIVLKIRLVWSKPYNQPQVKNHLFAKKYHEMKSDLIDNDVYSWSNDGNVLMRNVDKPQAHRQNFKRVSMLRLRLLYLYLGQSSSKTPSISKMKTWWQYCLMRNNIIIRTCVEFVPVPKRKQRNTFYNFSI